MFLAYSLFLNSTKRNVEVSTKGANLAAVAKGMASLRERPQSHPHSDIGVATEAEKGRDEVVGLEPPPWCQCWVISGSGGEGC